MNDVPMLALSCVAGLALGAVFFWGLWWTVCQAVLTKNPALWFLISLIARTSVVVVGFYCVSAGHWERLLSCLLGFTMARVVVQRVTGAKREMETRKVEVSRHAP